MYWRASFLACLGGLIFLSSLWAGCDSDDDGCDGCVIDEKCVAGGKPSPEDPCLVCDPARSRSAYSPRDCSDGVSCNGEELCNPDSGECEPGEGGCPDDEFCDPDIDACVVSCPYCSIDRVCYWENQRNPENPCQVCRSSEDPYGWTPNDGAVCDDGVFCNGVDSCEGGTCSVHGGDPCADDGLFCNGVESCDEASRSCVHSEEVCGDGETCDEDTQACCQARHHLGCSSEGDVVWVDSCGQQGDLVEECGEPPMGGCFGGECTCAEGATGPGCSGCVVFVSVSGDDTQGGRSWAAAKATLQAAIATADASSCPEVWVAEGVYPASPSGDNDESVMLTEGLRLYGGFSGAETSLSQRDVEAHPTVIDGELGDPAVPDDNSCRAVVLAEDSRLDGFTVQNGSGRMGCASSVDGVGVVAEGVDAKVESCIIKQNGGTWGVAAMRVAGNSHVHIHDTVFEANSAHQGALLVADTAQVDLMGSVFRMNGAHIATAIRLRAQAVLQAVGCSFEDNVSPTAFATVLFDDQANGSFTNCVFLRNQAQVGAVNDSGASVSFINCLVAGNEGSSIGGILAGGSESTVLQSTTVAANTGDITGGLWVTSTLVVVRDSILWGNISNAATVAESQLLQAQNAYPMVLFSTVEGGSVFPGQGNGNSDPLFINTDPANGPLDLHLSPGSPCIDSGSDALILPDENDLDGDGDVSEPTPFDLDRAARVAGAAVDMGAYESQ